MSAKFQTQLSAAEAASLALEYQANEKEMKLEIPALEAGRRIASGEYLIENLLPIIDWKSARRKGLVENSDQGDIADALYLANIAKSERAAVAVLVGLHGVGIPVASAILTAMDQERYTIIDFRALEALDAWKPSQNLDFYLDYLRYCRDAAAKFGLSLRDFDRALWMWSKKRPRKSQQSAIH